MTYHPAISFVGPYRIYVPADFLEVMHEGRIHRVQANPLPSLGNSPTIQAHGTQLEINHDVFGFAGRTLFRVVLSDEVDMSQEGWREAVCTNDHALVARALKVVNRLLRVYRDRDINRVGVSSFHVIELVRSDLSDIQLVVVDEQLRIVPEFAITWPGYKTMGFGDAINRDDEVTRRILDDLSSGTEIPIERELLTSAKNHLLRKQLRLAPVEANAAFESYAFASVLKIDPASSLPDSSGIYEKLRELEQRLSSGAAAAGRIFQLWFDPAIQGWSGLVCPHITRWKISCYDLRNRVLHRGYNEVMHTDAKDAIDHTEQAMKFIDQCISHVTER